MLFMVPSYVVLLIMGQLMSCDFLLVRSGDLGRPDHGKYGVLESASAERPCSDNVLWNLIDR